MPTYKCPECQLERETLAPSGVCFVCTEKTEATRLVEADVPTLTRELPDTVSHGSATDDWAGALPPGGYRYDDVPLGEGGMGVVWRAVRESTGETFAIKKLKRESFTPTGIRRFVAEARSLVAVRDDHVVRLHDFVPDPTDPFLVLELVPGESLGAHIRNVGPLHPDRAARMIAEAARGVDAAHNVGVIHRDLKPGNLLLTLDGKVKVADFGLCKTLGEGDVPELVGVTASGGEGNTPLAASTLTATGRLAGGTPGFMAPEQVSEDFGPVGRAADVWGLGACLHAALTAQAPFPVGKANMGLVLTEAHVPPHVIDPRVPEELSAIVVKCLQKEPCRRYESAAAVAADLEGYLAGEGTSVRPHSWPRRQWRKVRTTPAWVFGTAIGILAVAVGIGLAVVPKRNDDPLTAQQVRLAANNEVPLVEDGQPPATPQFLLGEAVITAPTREAPEFSFASRETVVLALSLDPGVDRYRILAEVCQLPPTPEEPGKGGGRFGLFWGYRQKDFPDGVRARAWNRWAVHDYPTVQTTPCHVQLGVSTLFGSATANPVPVSYEGPGLPADRALALPGRWHTLVLDVTPGGVTARLATGDPLVWPTDKIGTRYDKLLPQLNAKSGGRDLGTREWSPRSPVGVFVEGGRVAVRRFTLSPIPE